MQINMQQVRKWVGIATRVYREIQRARGGSAGQNRRQGDLPGTFLPDVSDRTPSSSPTSGSWENGGYPGDFRGRLTPAYAPAPDGRPDPGEIVWAWVPYEEDYTRGKDRPVLLVGRDGEYLLALMLTSKDRNNGEHRDADYVDIGSGAWDAQGRASEVKVDRVVRLLPSGVRREGAVLPRELFEKVARAL